MEEINDEYIKKYFKGNKRIINTNLVKYYYNKEGKKFNYEIYKYIMNRYNDSTSFKESLYRIFYNIEKRPKCKYCNKTLEYKNSGYKIFTDYCNFSCQTKYLNEIGKLNTKESILKGKESRENTMLQRYGVDNPYKLKKIREKIKNTFINHYGVDNPWKSKEIKNKLNYKLQAKHAFDTKRKNNTFNTSKEEDQVYEFLSQYIDVIRQFDNDERYPFNCDFYIEDLDLFIECNFHWTHGGHPYNENSIADQVNLQRWKAKNTRYYDNAINTWTKRDVEKRNKAKEENLNYIEFWSFKELKEYFIDYFENHYK